MIESFNMSNDKTPFHTHSGKNYLRVLALVLLITLLALSIYSIRYVGFLMITVIVACLLGLVCIRFPKIHLYDDSFEIVKKGLIKKFTDRDSFKYNDLVKVGFSPGFTDWNYLIVLTLFGSGGFGGNSKADQMIVKTTDDKIFVFNRFGGKSKFEKTIGLINEKIITATSK